MGSLYSKPKLPSPVSYLAAPVATPVAPVVADAPVTDTAAEKVSSLVRKKIQYHKPYRHRFAVFYRRGIGFPRAKIY